MLLSVYIYAINFNNVQVENANYYHRIKCMHYIQFVEYNPTTAYNLKSLKNYWYSQIWAHIKRKKRNLYEIHNNWSLFQPLLIIILLMVLLIQ